MNGLNDITHRSVSLVLSPVELATVRDALASWRDHLAMTEQASSDGIWRTMATVERRITGSLMGRVMALVREVES